MSRVARDFFEYFVVSLKERKNWKILSAVTCCEILQRVMERRGVNWIGSEVEGWKTERKRGIVSTSTQTRFAKFAAKDEFWMDLEDIAMAATSAHDLACSKMDL